MKNEENFSVHLNNKVYLLTSSSYFTKHEVTACTEFVYYVYIFKKNMLCLYVKYIFISYNIHTYTHIYIYIFKKCMCICVYMYIY